MHKIASHTQSVKLCDQRAPYLELRYQDKEGFETTGWCTLDFSEEHADSDTAHILNEAAGLL